MQVAIVRFVPRAHGAVVLGVCTPLLGGESQPDCLLINHLPFYEDVRSFAFASFDSKPDAVPNQGQLDAADALIDSMQLMEGENVNVNDSLFGTWQGPFDYSWFEHT